MHHHNVVAVYDLFTHRGAHYIAQEYVDGADLATALERERPLPWRVAAMIALEIARGLEAVHDRGTLHRDLKPANLLLGRRGEVKISDFGLALDASATSLTRPGVVLGTPSYMAPEQQRGERVDARADVFSFGCVLYEMLTGSPPFPADSGNAAGSGNAENRDASEVEPGPSLVERIQRQRYTPTRKAARGVPRSLARLVKLCLRAKASRRIATVREVRTRLERLLDRPSSADLRAELAAWLWQHGVFEHREAETLVLIPAVPPRRARTRRWAAVLAIAAAGLGLSLSVAWPTIESSAAAATRALEQAGAAH